VSGRDECEHGGLRRKCEICERDAEIASLHQRLAEAEADRAEASADFQEVATKMHAAEVRAERLEQEKDLLWATVDKGGANLSAMKAAEAQRNNLLARIHRDGGHYMLKHGVEKACADADLRVAEAYGSLEELAAHHIGLRCMLGPKACGPYLRATSLLAALEGRDP